MATNLHYKSSIYNCWINMRSRCNNPNHPSYHNYGGRGIVVCQRWNDFNNFLEDMGPKPDTNLTIERIDNNKDYEPGNCQWATWDMQNNNKRDKSNHNKKKTHCSQGHPLSGVNLYIDPRGRRGCRECRKARCRVYFLHKAQKYTQGSVNFGN